MRMHDVGGLTQTCLVDAVATARNMSADEAAWGLLENSVAEFVLLQDVHELSEKEEMLDSEIPLNLAAASTVILSWLVDLVADYLHGVRHKKVSAIRDATGCTVWEACFHLGVWSWEQEMALCSYHTFCRGTSECEVPLNTHRFQCVLQCLGRAAKVGVALIGKQVR